MPSTMFQSSTVILFFGIRLYPNFYFIHWPVNLAGAFWNLHHCGHIDGGGGVGDKRGLES